MVYEEGGRGEPQVPGCRRGVSEKLPKMVAEVTLAAAMMWLVVAAVACKRSTFIVIYTN